MNGAVSFTTIDITLTRQEASRPPDISTTIAVYSSNTSLIEVFSLNAASSVDARQIVQTSFLLQAFGNLPTLTIKPI